MSTIKDIDRISKEADLKLYDDLREGIVGLAVDYPILFMDKVDLRKMERHELELYILPESFFT